MVIAILAGELWEMKSITIGGEQFREAKVIYEILSSSTTKGILEVLFPSVI